MIENYRMFLFYLAVNEHLFFSINMILVSFISYNCTLVFDYSSILNSSSLSFTDVYNIVKLCDNSNVFIFL